MAKYEIEFRRSVEKELSKIPQRDQIRILQRIRELLPNPRPQPAKSYPVKSDTESDKEITV